MLEQQTKALLLRGKVVEPDGSANDRYILVRDGVIDTISRRRPPVTGETPTLDLRPDDWIFPGLLNLHSHTSYNLLPIWKTDKAWSNRFEWRKDSGYRTAVSGVYDFLRQTDTTAAASTARSTVIAVFSELQAIAGGTTLLQENRDITSDEKLEETVLCRSTANSRDLGLPDGHMVQSVLEFFRPEDGKPVANRKAIDDYVKARRDGNLGAALVHLAEGRSGFDGRGSPGPDPYTRAEFEAFMEHPAFKDAAEVRKSPLAIIHGCGIDVHDDAHLGFLRDRDISVIWSPVSNLLLYHQTIDMEKIVLAGINVALGSDWTPSGSKHVWDEAKFARFYLSALGSEVSDAQIFQMVTSNPARCLGSRMLGQLTEGAAADMLVLRSPIESDSALEVFFKTMDRDVLAVLVGGIPRYGSKEILGRLTHYDWQSLSSREGRAVAGKRVYLPPRLTNENGESISASRDLNALEDILKKHRPKVERANLLASSDRNYRELIKNLRARTVDYGWTVEQSQFYWRFLTQRTTR